MLNDNSVDEMNKNNNKKMIDYMSNVVSLLLYITIIMITLYGAMLFKFSRVESELAQIRSSKISPFQLIYLGKFCTTAYSDRVCETDDSPRHTSTGGLVSHNIIAVSQDMLKDAIVKYGDVIYIKELNEIRTVGDCMNKRWEKKFDLFYYNRNISSTFDPREFTYYKVVTK